MKGARNTHVAHSVLKRKKYYFDHPEIKKVCQSINKYFLALNIDHTRKVIPLEYDPARREISGQFKETDIELILESIALHSEILRMPEHDPDNWTQRKKPLSEYQKESLNKYRKKVGLPEV